ncbi:MAG: hypothetical protein IH597_09265 [Bacteroidales bacterium]|nr:hypothetical protein [Bacteroidales bacterium]
MKKNLLSKSTFIRGMQCHKSLYLYKHRYFLRDKLLPEQLAKFKRGTNVGVLARQLFPNGFDASPPIHFQTARAVETTRELVARKHPVIYEAYFSNDSVVVALDILEHRDGKWYGYEVKSSLSISETYLNDAALQYHVISNCGVDLEDFSIIYMNKDYVRQAELDLNQLFITQSVLEEARSRQPMIAEEIAAQLKVTELSKSPAIDIGPHCNKPYPCDFQGHCWKHIPKNSIFELQLLNEEQKFELYSKSILLLVDIPDDFLTDPVQKMKLQAHKTATPFIDKEFIRGFIEKIEYAVCFLKVWYHRPAVPLYAGTRPYEKLPFFLSTGHAYRSFSEPELKHHYFEPGQNSLPVFYQLLIEILETSKSIILFDDVFLIDKVSVLNSTIQPGSNKTILDLSAVLKSNYYYDPQANQKNELPEIPTVASFSTSVKDLFASELEASSAYNIVSGKSKEQEDFMIRMQASSHFQIQKMSAFFKYLKIITEPKFPTN